MSVEIVGSVFLTIVSCGLSYLMQYWVLFEEPEMAGPAYFYSFIFYPLSFVMAVMAAESIWGHAAGPYGGGFAIVVAVVVFSLMWRKKQRLARII
jgi:hypothetical protein